MMGPVNVRRSSLCSARRTTSFFSGLGTAEVAWKAIGGALCRLGLPFQLRQAFSCEVDRTCQQLLQLYNEGHVYTDLMDMMSTPGLDIEGTFEQQAEVVGRAAVRTCAVCARCRRRCPVVRGDIDTSGSPCQDWSVAGRRLGSSGKRIHLLLTWMRWHRVMETPIIIHENVVGFDLTLLTTHLGDLYTMSYVRVGPEHVGWPCCKRPRLYVALIHRRKVRWQCDPVWLFWQVSSRLRTSLRVRDCLIASEFEVHGEFEKRRAQQLGRVSFAAPSRLPQPVASRLPQPVGRAPLTRHEKIRLEAYFRLWTRRSETRPLSEPDLVFNLGDNPDGGWLTWSAPSTGGEHRVPTFRKSWTAQWVPHRQRWLTSTERLVLMGFPASPALSCCYSMTGSYQLEWEARHTVGNAMHLANVGVWQSCVAVCAVIF